MSCHWYARDNDGNVYVVAEWYAAKQSLEYHSQKIKEISARLNWHTDKYGRIEALIDSAANQRTLNGQRSVAELFYEQGIAVNPRVNKDLYTGISKVKSLLKPALGPPKLFIFSCCTNMIREIKGYFWGSGDSPVKRDDHAMDELRYYVCSLEDVATPKPQKSAITIDKERLSRKLRQPN